MGNWSALAFAVVLLLLNGFFVGAEFALISARRSAVEPHARAGSRAARITVSAMEQVSLMMATAQLGITLASLGLGALGEPAVAHLLEPVFHAIGMSESASTIVSFVIALGIVVFLHVVLGEMIPKNIALAGPDRVALWLTPPLVMISKLLWPFVMSLNALANLVLRLLRVEPKDEVSSTFNRDQVGELVAESRREGLLDDAEQALLAGALGFEEQTVSDAMVPMDRVVTVPASATRSEVERIAAQAGFSRLPVVAGGGPGGGAGAGAGTDAADQGGGGVAGTDGGEGTPVGYLHLKDLLILDGEDPSETVPARLLRPLPRLDHGVELGAALEMMQRQQVHLALVTDSRRRATTPPVVESAGLLSDAHRGNGACPVDDARALHGGDDSGSGDGDDGGPAWRDERPLTPPEDRRESRQDDVQPVGLLALEDVLARIIGRVQG